MRTLLEEQYEAYLNPERAKLLQKNRRTLHQLDVLQAKLNHYAATNDTENLTEEEARLREMVITNSPGNHAHNSTPLKERDTADAACQTFCTGDIRPVHCDEFYDDNLGIVRNKFPSELILDNGEITCDTLENFR